MEEEEKDQQNNQQDQGKNKEPLPYCTTAPSAEHARKDNEDEPCDDARAGDVGIPEAKND